MTIGPLLVRPGKGPPSRALLASRAVAHNKPPCKLPRLWCPKPARKDGRILPNADQRRLHCAASRLQANPSYRKKRIAALSREGKERARIVPSPKKNMTGAQPFLAIVKEHVGEIGEATVLVTSQK
jgi:hypothetical protein